MRVGIPISLGYFAVSFALGITCRSVGMTALQSGVMSLGMLASAGEFAAVTLIGSGAGMRPKKIMIQMPIAERI